MNAGQYRLFGADLSIQTVIAGFFTGGALAVRGGLKAARNSAIGCACLLAVIEGVGIGIQRMMAENTRLDVSLFFHRAPLPFQLPGSDSLPRNVAEKVLMARLPSFLYPQETRHHLRQRAHSLPCLPSLEHCVFIFFLNLSILSASHNPSTSSCCIPHLTLL